MISFIKHIFLHFFPLTCPSCKKETIDASFELCNSCYSKLSFVPEPFCKSCGGYNNTIFDICSNCMKEDKHPWQHAISLFEMKDLSRDLIIKYKYYKDIPLARFFSNICCKKIKLSNLEINIITHIPLHWAKHLKRGFNQSSLIEKMISRELRIHSKTLLVRSKFTKSQTKLATKKRRKNIIDAFKPIKCEQIKNKKILLIDDVYTTGSTLREASKVLLKAGAKEIYILTLARR
jgi:competence protein ComFC